MKKSENTLNLQSELTKFFKISQNQKLGLKKLKISTISDLLYHFPRKYGNETFSNNIEELKSGDFAVIFGKVVSSSLKKSFHTKINIAEIIIEDIFGKKIKATFFSQPYVSKMLPVDTLVKFSGNITGKKINNKEIFSFTNPNFEKVNEIPLEKSAALFESSENDKIVLNPIYKESKFITSRWINHKIKMILSNKEFLENLKDPIPENILKKYSLPSLKNSFFFIHLPQKEIDIKVSKKRFAFEEVFFIQIIKQKEKLAYQKFGGFIIESKKDLEKEFLKTLPFKLTSAQKKAILDIKKDFKSGLPASRLIEGDVGSGKTIIAALASFLTVKTKPKNQNFGSLQVAYMTPTEILTKQIFFDFIEMFKNFNISIGLLTSKDCRIFPSKTEKMETKISKKKLLEKTLNGEIKILIGTHSLISKNVFFENLGLVIIDEQHRFGKKQRQALRAKPTEKKKKEEKEKLEKKFSAKKEEKLVKKKGLAKNEEILPHLISMSATPIPRTLALTIFGDLDLTVIDQSPPGRKKVITESIREITDDNKRKEIYQKIYERVKKEKKQAYVICPRINEPEEETKYSLNVKSAVSEQKHLQKIFPDLKIGLLHSKLGKDKKDIEMEKFKNKEYDILVSTSVVEVGVNVPNATSIIIEGAERFGLSQIHQLRGRVMRSSDQPYCYLFTTNNTEKTAERLTALKKSKNGFELAEFDLQFRGAGELIGNKQSGVSDLAMEAMKNIKMIEAARNEAVEIAKNFENKYNYNITLQEKIKEMEEKIHME